MSTSASKTIAFVVSRIGGEDGVSLEAMHWMRIFRDRGHRVEIITGQRQTNDELDGLERSGQLAVHIIDAADPDPRQTRNQREWSELFEAGVVSDATLARAAEIERALVRLLDARAFDLLVLENFTLPWYHSSLGVAASRVVLDRRMPTVSRGHDFPHDRPAYAWDSVSAEVRQWVERAVPRAPWVAHVAINTRDRDLGFVAMGIDGATVVPNALDPRVREVGARMTPERVAGIRAEILGEAHAQDFVAVCPVRPVARKRLDVAVALLSLLRAKRPDLRVSMLVTHDPVDATEGELMALRAAAKFTGVHLAFGHRHASAYEQYAIGDFALYLSDFEGFGNGLLEVVGAGLPTVINPYEIYRRDIERIGLEVGVVDIAGDLGSDLDAQTEALAALLDRKGRAGASLVVEDASRVERNRARVEAAYGYEAIGAILDRVINGVTRSEVARP